MKPFICTMPMRLDEGWNQIQFNLADFTRRAYPTCLESEERESRRVRVRGPSEEWQMFSFLSSFWVFFPFPLFLSLLLDFLLIPKRYGTNYIETLSVQIHANCRIRRIYFSDRLYSEDELPAEYKLFLPVQKQ